MGTYSSIDLDKTRNFTTRPPTVVGANAADLVSIQVRIDDSGYDLLYRVRDKSDTAFPLVGYETQTVGVNYSELSPSTKTKIQETILLMQTQGKNKLQQIGT